MALLFGGATVSCDKATVLVSMVDYAAEVRVVQHFVNSSGADAKEAVYTFPLPERAAVFAYQATIGSGTIVGRIKAKDEAREMYECARKAGQSAQLLEQKRGDVFQLSLGNVAKGSTVVVKLSYVAECTLEAGDWTQLVIPAAVGARYHPEGETDPIGSGSLGAGAPVTFTLHAVMPSAINQVKLSSSKNDLGTGAKTAAGSWTVPSMAREEVIRILCAKPHEPRLVVEKSADGSHACMLTLAPSVADFDGDSKQQDIVFVCDCSGSMFSSSDASSRDRQLLSALKIAMRGLPAVGTRVSILLFGDRFQSFLGGSVPLTQAVVDRVTALHQLSNMGGTELLPALEHVFAQPLAEGVKQRQVIVMTDGEVSNTREVIATVESANRANRVFTLGIGASVSRELVSGVSRAGRGVAEFVFNDGQDNEKLQASVMRLVSLALRPALQNVAVTWSVDALSSTSGASGAPESGVVPMEVEQSVFGAVNALAAAQAAAQAAQTAAQALQDSVVKQAPFVVPPVFANTRYTVYCMMPPGVEPPTEAVLSADQLPPTKVKVTDKFVQGSTVLRLAARELIRDLEEKRSALHLRTVSSSESVRAEVRRLGLQYTLASSETSFVAIDPATGNAVRAEPAAVLESSAAEMGGVRYKSNSGPCGVRKGLSCTSTALSTRSFGARAMGAISEMFSGGGEEEMFYGGREQECDRRESWNLSWPAKPGKSLVLRQILQLQRLDGSWHPSAELFKLLGLAQKKFDDGLATSNAALGMKLDATTWATLLVLAHLHKRAAASKDVWTLAADKARTFAAATDQMLDEAAHFLP